VLKHKQIRKYFGIREDVFAVSLDDFVYVQKAFKLTGWKIIYFS